MEHLLDNAVWNGMSTGNSHLVHGTENVKFFLPGVSPFAGVRRFDDECFDELRELLPPGERKLLKLPEEVELPSRFRALERFYVSQMLGMKVRKVSVDDTNMRPLEEKDVTGMIALTKKMNPGPFSRHTIEFGHYRGIFSEGQLVSMAGQRFHAGPFAEISAVCTCPEFGGRGYGGRLVSDQVNRMLAGGETPFLHVMSDREKPIRLYQNLGFEIRKKFVVYLIAR